MADDVDMTTERAIPIEAQVAASKKAEGPAPCGFCYACEAAVPDDRRWCDAECRDEHADMVAAEARRAGR